MGGGVCVHVCVRSTCWLGGVVLGVWCVVGCVCMRVCVCSTCWLRWIVLGGVWGGGGGGVCACKCTGKVCMCGLVYDVL